MSIKYVRLTRLAARSLKPGQRIEEHGIVARCNASGNIVYSVNVMVDGRRIHRVVGKQSDGVTREQAERYIEKLRTDAREKRFNMPSGRKLYRRFVEASDEYMTTLRAAGGKNLVPKARHLRMHLQPAFKNYRLDALTDVSISQYRKDRARSGAAIATVNRELATLRHFLKSAVAWKWIASDALPVISMEAEPIRPMVALDDNQARLLMQAALSDPDDRCALFVAFGLGAAMRHREILRVRYDQIDFGNQRILIPKAKSGQREQPITKALADTLLRQRATERPESRDGWVFPTLNVVRAHQGHRTSFARPFARCVTRAGLDLKTVTPHTMRRTAITKLVRAGVDLPTIQKISGHKTYAMVLRYVHMQSDHVNTSIASLEALLPCAITRELHAV